MRSCFIAGGTAIACVEAEGIDASASWEEVFHFD
jgi:hypothetical protein